MDRERNLDSIRTLEEQIREHERSIVQLKRARNSLLNVSTLLPPELLGSIFRWNVTPDGDFGGLPKASYNFLLVCHHWFQVASGTPELWGFWGNSIQDWAHRHVCCRTAPLDLVLGRTSRDLDDTLRDALQDRAARDTIRRVHLSGANAELLNSVISSITTKGGGTRPIGVVSFILRSNGGSRVDITNFFSQYHFPKLQRLDISGNSISWDLSGSRIMSLTTLELTAIELSPLPTLSQMISILSANPNLQSLVLLQGSLPDVDNDRSSPRVQLHHLKTLKFRGGHRRVFGLLDRLELPDEMDDLNLSLSECPPSTLPQTLGSYLGNRAQRRSPGRLRLSVNPGLSYFSIQVGDVHEGDPTWANWFMAVDGTTSVTLGEEEADNLCFHIIAHIPQEKVIGVKTTLPILRSEELCVRMCNLAELHLHGVNLSTWFVEPDAREPHAFKGLLPRLCSITIIGPHLSGGDWSSLTNFLTRRAAVRNGISSLRLARYPHMDEGVVESIKRAVEVFEDWGR
jgi:hypothetical protein